jgi:transcriptional regulator of arginine metabolism
MQKVSRLLAIERIISLESISSQDELLKKLKGEGITCTQATLSRNLRQLGVLKIPDGRGGYKYAVSDKRDNSFERTSGYSVVAAVRALIDARGMILIRTIPGHANSVAVIIDNAGRYEIAGTIAGDDTLLIIPRDNVSLSHLHSCLEMSLPGLHKQVRNE